MFGMKNGPRWAKVYLGVLVAVSLVFFVVDVFLPPHLEQIRANSFESRPLLLYHVLLRPVGVLGVSLCIFSLFRWFIPGFARRGLDKALLLAGAVLLALWYANAAYVHWAAQPAAALVALLRGMFDYSQLIWLPSACLAYGLASRLPAKD